MGNDIKTRSGLLVGKGEISEFLGGASDYMLKKYLEMGMPVAIEGTLWIAHKKNIEEFFEHYTRRKVANAAAAMRGAGKGEDHQTDDF
jgi:hypothetical protein